MFPISRLLWRLKTIPKSNIIKDTCRQFSKYDIAAQELLDQIYTSVKQQRFEDIVVIGTKFNANPRYLLLASAFSSRHLSSGTELVNKNFKTSIRKPDDEFATVSLSSNWNVIDMEEVVIHLFSRDCRKHFDIEQLWAAGAEYDDLTNGRAEVPDYDGLRPVAESAI